MTTPLVASGAGRQDGPVPPRGTLAAIDVAFRHGDAEVLRGASLEARRGEAVAVTGASGSGKSTLLAVMAGLLVPSAGKVLLDGEDLGGLGDAARRRLRLRRFGFVFQFGDLIPELRVVENVELPARLLGLGGDEARARAMATLQLLDVDRHHRKRVGELSGGELQRVAVARAVVHQPAFVFADEPTGSLDDVNARAVLALLADVVQVVGAGLVLVTHDLEVAATANRVVTLRAGRIAT